MAKMVQVPYNYDVSVPIETAQSVQGNRENPVSLEALGLLVNLLSYPMKWELHKTELYKRFAKNKETSVRSAWKDLMETGYIIEFKYRVGKKYEYVYYLRKVPFTANEQAEILENARNEHGEIWGLDFQDLKMESSKPRANKDLILNKNTILNKDDDDKRTSPPVQESSIQDVKEITTENIEDIAEIEDPETIINELRAITKDDLQTVSFNAVVKKVMDMYIQEKIGQGNFRSYLMTALTTRMQELQERREQKKQDKASQQPKQSYARKHVKTEVLPVWFQERKDATQQQQSATTDNFDVELERQRLLEELNQ